MWQCLVRVNLENWAQNVTDFVLAVFGVSLEELCRRDNVKVPTVVDALLGEIEIRGIKHLSRLDSQIFRRTYLLGYRTR